MTHDRCAGVGGALIWQGQGVAVRGGLRGQHRPGWGAGGFSLIELMVTVAILVLVVLVAPPAFDAMLLNSRLNTYATDFMAAAQTARSEAIKRNARVLLCVSSDGATCTTGNNWQAGWIVVHDADSSGTFTAGESVLLKHEALNTSYAFTNVAAAAANAIVVYEPTGAVASAVVLKLSRTSPAATQWRELQVSATGRAMSNTCRASGTNECTLP